MQHGTIAEQLAPLASEMRTRASIIRPVSQVLLRLPSPITPESAFQSAQQEVLKWLRKRAGQNLPASAWNGQTFEMEEVGAQRASAVAIDNPLYWAARLDDADQNVPQRTWTTEIGVGIHPSGGIIFGCRLICVTRGEDYPFQPSVPGFVRQIIETQGALLDDRHLEIQPSLISSEDDVDNLVELLTSPSRKSDVYLVSLPEDSQDINDAVLSAVNLHSRTLGTAHVMVITGPASFHLTDRVGKEFSVFRQAVRTYRPGFDHETDEPFRHPLAMPQKILHWDGDENGAIAFEGFLIRQALQRSVSAGDIEKQVPPFATVRRIAAERSINDARNAGASDAEILHLAEEEIAKLRAAIDEQKNTYDGLLLEAEQERSIAEHAEEEAKAAQHRLSVRLRLIESQLRDRSEGIRPSDRPTSLEELQPWAEKELSGSVFLHSRAFVGVKKAEFEDIPLIYETLLLLRDYYVPMRREGGLNRKEEFDTRCRELGLEESATFGGAGWGEQGEEYKIQFGGRKRLLDRHLKKGSAREPRHCFRLYFFWDDDGEQVVVGWLPSHLTTRGS